MNTLDFSYRAYKKILLKYKDDIIDYSDIKNKKKYVLLRHDVEFSPQRALSIAKLEESEGISSSYLFQVRSNAYNVLSTINRNIIENILELGHKVGLHFYVSHINKYDWKSLEYELIEQQKIINFAINKNIDRFSFHRPPDWVLEKRDDKINNLINMYGKSFFEFSNNPTKIKYIADSKHQFCYGHPLNDHNYPKIQILLHPDEWTNSGLDAKDNFASLEEEKLEQIKLTFQTETKIYSKLYSQKLLG